MKFERVAVYYAPQADDPLAEAGAAWLGRDAVRGVACAQPDLPEIAHLTDDARLYGFHATLKPPMRLKPDLAWQDVLQAANALAGRIAPFDLPALALADLHGFLALRETVPCPALHALADICVAELDDLRAPPSADETARRRRSTLSAAHNGLLERWGYPYVFGTWEFHMTLSRRLSTVERDFWKPKMEAFFAPALAATRCVVDICLFTQPEPGLPFTIAARIPLRG